MTLQESGQELTRVPPAAQQGLHGLSVYRFEVPYIKDPPPWRERVLAVAPGTYRPGAVMSVSRKFPKPAQLGPYFTLALVTCGTGLSSGRHATEYAEKSGLALATPHHLFDAVAYIGPLNKGSHWDDEYGPGILATEPAVNLDLYGEDACFALWYPDDGRPARASVKGFNRCYGPATLFAFVDPRH